MLIYIMNTHRHTQIYYTCTSLLFSLTLTCSDSLPLPPPLSLTQTLSLSIPPSLPPFLLLSPTLLSWPLSITQTPTLYLLSPTLLSCPPPPSLQINLSLSLPPTSFSHSYTSFSLSPFLLPQTNHSWTRFIHSSIHLQHTLNNYKYMGIQIHK